MAETIYTKDGKCHILLGSTTPVSIIRDYCGDEVLERLSAQIEDLCFDVSCMTHGSDMGPSRVAEIDRKLKELKDIFI